jgi:hypothetical protein
MLFREIIAVDPENHMEEYVVMLVRRVTAVLSRASNLSTKYVQEDRKVTHIKLKVVINCIVVNIMISRTARWYCRSTNNE